MEQPIGIRLPKEILKKIESLGKQENEDRSTIVRRLVLAGYMEIAKQKAAEDYLKGKITLSEAASRAGLTLWEIESVLVQQGFKSQYSIDDLEKELQSLK
ncbi:MAG TPA: UPF0175 family protein [Candidatus Nanoarchaeia archaeon]|nr:UPF0175 family protein [Candidatus Nanoarchaeia archaeon]